jgi:hypothetical protein
VIGLIKNLFGSFTQKDLGQFNTERLGFLDGPLHVMPDEPRAVYRSDQSIDLKGGSDDPRKGSDRNLTPAFQSTKEGSLGGDGDG